MQIESNRKSHTILKCCWKEKVLLTCFKNERMFMDYKFNIAMVAIVETTKA